MRRHDRSGSLAILCGGLSTRFGSDKGLFNPLNDETLITRLIRIFGKDFAEILIIVRGSSQRSNYQRLIEKLFSKPTFNKIRILCDLTHYPAAPHAALAGVYTAISQAREAKITILPVDGIGIRPLHLKKLMAKSANAAVTCFGGYNRNEETMLPFPSVWSREVAGSIKLLLEDGNLSVRSAIMSLGAHFIDAEPYTKELQINANTRETASSYFGQPLFDPFGRRLHYLRFSLTETCNMACQYCLPEGHPEWYRHKATLTTNEIGIILQGFRQLGFRKVRFTGGEPTVHPGCLKAVIKAREIGYEDIAITTNGTLIQNLESWVDAGLNQINISLDSVDFSAFEKITRNKQFNKILSLIDQAITLGITVKINTVLMRSINGSDYQIQQMIDWALSKPVTLRFIELMDTKLNQNFASKERVLGSQIKDILAARGLMSSSESESLPALGGPSSDYWHPNFIGRIGLINPMSCNFCSRCNRLRVTAKAELKLCLFGNADHKLNLSSPTALQEQVRNLIEKKPERHHLEAGDFGNVATFRTIGG